MRDRPNDKHRQILEAKLGRKLLPNEVADHEDLDKTNNAPENLKPMTRSEHSKSHTTPERRGLGRLRKALTINDKTKMY